MSSFEEVLTAARSLDPHEQIHLASLLWEQVEPEKWPTPDAAWIAEAQRRSAEYDAGRNTASLWSEVRSRARSKAGLDD